MKLSDIDDTILSESPLGIGGRALDAVAAKIPHRGTKQKAKGKQEAKAAAIQLLDYYYKQAGRSGIKSNTPRTIKNFLAQYNVNSALLDAALEDYVAQGASDAVDPEDIKLSKSQVEHIFLDIAQQHSFQNKEKATKIPSNVIDGIKNLSPEQKDQLVKVLTGTKLV